MPTAASPSPSPSPDGALDVRIEAVRYEAVDICSFELRSLGGPLPDFQAGAHVTLHLKPGLERSYSLVERAPDGRHYRIVVKKETTGRGGSRHLHEGMPVGTRLRIEPPKNLFALDECAARSVLIAGGIGVTPLFAMARRLAELGRPWTMHYAARSPEHAALAEPLAALAGGGLQMHYDSGGRPTLSIERLIREAPADTHFYCCGPAPMLDGFIALDALAPGRMHFERFSNAQAARPGSRFVVRLHRTQQEVEIEDGQSILDALLARGFDLSHSCREGLCGACEVAVLDGVPDHRDLILDDAQRVANTCMMICCSRALTPTLTLDI